MEIPQTVFPAHLWLIMWPQAEWSNPQILGGNSIKWKDNEFWNWKTLGWIFAPPFTFYRILAKWLCLVKPQFLTINQDNSAHFTSEKKQMGVTGENACQMLGTHIWVSFYLLQIQWLSYKTMRTFLQTVIL